MKTYAAIILLILALGTTTFLALRANYGSTEPLDPGPSRASDAYLERLKTARDSRLFRPASEGLGRVEGESRSNELLLDLRGNGVLRVQSLWFGAESRSVLHFRKTYLDEERRVVLQELLARHSSVDESSTGGLEDPGGATTEAQASQSTKTESKRRDESRLLIADHSEPLLKEVKKLTAGLDWGEATPSTVVLRANESKVDDKEGLPLWPLRRPSLATLIERKELTVRSGSTLRQLQEAFLVGDVFRNEAGQSARLNLSVLF